MIHLDNEYFVLELILIVSVQLKKVLCNGFPYVCNMLVQHKISTNVNNISNALLKYFSLPIKERQFRHNISEKLNSHRIANDWTSSNINDDGAILTYLTQVLKTDATTFILEFATNQKAYRTKLGASGLKALLVIIDAARSVLIRAPKKKLEKVLKKKA
uniref:Uncharacterized protein n=1 Tax=Romanomermis culicivorax TaxID=13658 RepID=A0A915HN16_ROMCU